MSRKMTIAYCVQWNYLPRAASLADVIRDETGIEAELIRSRGGAFEVTLDGELIYSKLHTGSFPDQREILRSVQQK